MRFTRIHKTVFSSLTVVTACSLALAACSNPDARTGSQATGTEADKLVLLDSNETGAYNPISGYGKLGDSPVYEGLYRLKATDNKARIIDFEPVLATGPATPSDNAQTWTVELKGSVKFSDGSAFDANDVAATYRALLDKRSASSEVSSWEMLDTVETQGNKAVFKLKYSYPEFDHLLLNGIAPSESFDFNNLESADKSPLNTHPIGTGPYKLESLRSDEAVFTARDDYHGGAVAVKKLVYRVNHDENSRAQQMRGGEGDGTILEPHLAENFSNTDGLSVHSAQTADWRGITLPAANPVTGDQAVRDAVNLAVDRQSMAKNVLKGHAQPNSTFFSALYGNAYDPNAEIPFDTARAEKILDDAGWVKGEDGVRHKGNQRAAFDVIYFPNRDQARKDLTLAAASDLKKIGIEVTPIARDSGSVTREDYAQTPVMLGGGGTPYTVDGQIYTILHSKYAQPGVGAKWDNASDYVNPRIDQLLDKARSEMDQNKRDTMYREIQKLYAEKPAMLQLVYVNHVYVERDRGYTHPDTNLVEPHGHGMNYGPWYNMAAWHK